jgi:paired amphipathic helix protein Sin3a
MVLVLIMLLTSNCSIDTPGVIDRVSSLFRGNPNLIQGFNTFLPPGYRIECSSDPTDPNPIRVTTPMGTTTYPDGEAGAAANNHAYDRWKQPQQQQSQAQQSQHQSSSQTPHETGGYSESGAAVNNAASSMTQLHAAANSSRDPGQMNTDTEQRRQGVPVEFNHAINYVNKIKTRFVNQPDIYKNFLEILQTYQRDQLRISEVYTQVTALFQDAPDLLDDFKQFLPDTSQPQATTPRTAQESMAGANSSQLPPLGNFAPPSAGRERERKSKKQQDYGPPPSFDPNSVPVSSVRGGPGPSVSKPGRSKARGGEPSSPTLMPQAPEPVPQPPRASNLTDEITFFDKVKKYIGNKQTYNEFLKVLNLFSQKIIDKNVLVERVDGFIGGNKELMDWFKRFVKYEGTPLHIENITFKKHVLELSLCQSHGPSYRLLPKSDTYMPCSGRDEMCWEVLNDEWVVHPTWASEDSGFVAHRKNQYEEILYRVEEERHEYDYYIEANLRSIQTLEAIANRIANMTPEERANFTLPPGLGHTSTIYQKVIRKIYDKERGQEVIEALHQNPSVAVPIVLKRLKQKDEEWKRAHREWNKVWRDTEQKVFYKSLDHLGLTFKQTDKKLMTSRNLVSEITTVKAEQTAQKKGPSLTSPKVQLSYKMDDSDVLMDVLRLVLCFLEHAGSYSSTDRERMEEAIKAFMQLFFSLPVDMIKSHFPPSDMSRKGSPDSDAGSEAGSPGAVSRKRPRDPTGDLLRDVLRKSKQPKSTNGRAGSDSAAGSREQSPDETENADKASTPAAQDGSEDKADEESTAASNLKVEPEESWLRHADEKKDEEGEAPKRSVYNLFANTTIYVFMRFIQTLYVRLKEVKEMERVVSKEIANSGNVDFAKDLNLYDHRLADMGLQFESNDCYGQLLNLSEKLIEGEVEHQSFEEAIRQAYRNRAYKFYTVDKVVQGLVKHIHLIVTEGKTSETLMLFQADRQQPTSDIKQQINYRTQVKKIIGADENMFRIDWDDENRQIGFQFLGRYDLTLSEIENTEDEWNYYLTSYMMSVPTEGVPPDQVKAPLLYRSMVDNIDENYSFSVIEQGLMARVCVNTYKLFFESGTSDYFARPAALSQETRTPKVVNSRKTRWRNFLEGHDGWKSELEEEEIANGEERFKVWKEQGPKALSEWKPPHKVPAEPTEEEAKNDETMEEAGAEKSKPDSESASADANIADTTNDGDVEMGNVTIEEEAEKKDEPVQPLEQQQEQQNQEEQKSQPEEQQSEDIRAPKIEEQQPSSGQIKLEPSASSAVPDTTAKEEPIVEASKTTPPAPVSSSEEPKLQEPEKTAAELVEESEPSATITKSEETKPEDTVEKETEQSAEAPKLDQDVKPKDKEEEEQKQPQPEEEKKTTTDTTEEKRAASEPTQEKQEGNNSLPATESVTKASSAEPRGPEEGSEEAKKDQEGDVEMEL